MGHEWYIVAADTERPIIGFSQVSSILTCDFQDCVYPRPSSNRPSFKLTEDQIFMAKLVGIGEPLLDYLDGILRSHLCGSLETSEDSTTP